MNRKGILCVLGLAFLVSALTAHASVLFEDNGNVSFRKGSGHAWWDFTQSDGYASLFATGSSGERLTGTDSFMTIDKADPSRFSMSTDLRFRDDLAPTGKLDFTRDLGSGGVVWSNLHVYDKSANVFIGYDNTTGKPIYVTEMQSNFTFNVGVNAMIDSLNVNVGSWATGDGTSIWYGGDLLSIGQYGKLLGPNAASIGRNLVASGAATYGTVPGNIPEPASVALLAVGSLLIGFRGRRKDSRA